MVSRSNSGLASSSSDSSSFKSSKWPNYAESSSSGTVNVDRRILDLSAQPWNPTRQRCHFGPASVFSARRLLDPHSTRTMILIRRIALAAFSALTRYLGKRWVGPPSLIRRRWGSISEFQLSDDSNGFVRATVCQTTSKTRTAIAVPAAKNHEDHDQRTPKQFFFSWATRLCSSRLPPR